MPEKRTEIVKTQGLVPTIPPHKQLMPVNDSLRGGVVFFMIVVIVLGAILTPKTDTAVTAKKINVSSLSSEGMNPVISAEVNALKGQLIGLVSGSIESKLRSLETSLKSGQVNNSLGTIEDLKRDLKVLQTYSVSDQKQNIALTNQDLAKEVTHLRDLLYMFMTSCALMFVAAAGVWVKYRKRLPYNEVKNFLGKR